MYIEDMKEQISKMEQHIRETVAALAKMRIELIQAGKSNSEGNKTGIFVDDEDEEIKHNEGERDEGLSKEKPRPVPLSELLAFASRISKYTAPPPRTAGQQYRQQQEWESSLDNQKFKKENDHRREEHGTAPNNDNQNGTELANNSVSSPVAADKPTTVNELYSAGDTGIAFASLSESERNWQLHNTAAVPFMPWPSDEEIRSGGLAHLQSLIERGAKLDDLITFPGTPEKHLNKGREASQKDEAEMVGPAQEESGITVEGNGTTSEAVQADQRAKQQSDVFGGLDLYDPDEV